MSKQQTVITHAAGIRKARWVPLVQATEFGLLLAVAGLLCSCSSPARHAVGVEGGGQRIISPEHAKLWNQTLSEQEWLQLLRQRVHQPIATWRGVGSGSIEAGTSGLSFSGLSFRDSASYVLEHHLSSQFLMERHPLLFLGLFDDPDPETVLTGVAAYRRVQLATRLLDPATTGRIADAFRQKLLAHRDVRVRWAAVQTLGENRWLTPTDIQRGLADETDEIRVTTAFWMPVVAGEWNRSFYANAQRDPTSPRPTPPQMHDCFVLVATTCLDHLNDNHWYVRQAAGGTFVALFQQWKVEGEGKYSVQDATGLPESFDWVRSDWQTRCAAQEQWKQWWAQHGVDTLRRAHPFVVADTSR